MKKLLVFLLSLLSLFGFISCSSKNYEQYTSLIADSVNNEYSVDAEVDYWTGTYFEKEYMVDKSCLVLDNMYFGSYKKSIIDKMNSYTTDIYVDENSVEFGLREDTGELAYINLMNADFFDTQPYLPDVQAPYETAVRLTKEIASQFIDNIDDYTQIIEEPKIRYKERDGVTYQITYYVVTFAKKINGYFSSDYISVKVTSKGTLASIMMGDINAFANTSIDFELETINQSISKKIESTYKYSKFKVKEANIDDQKIVLTPKGDICLYTAIVIDGEDDLKNEKTSGLHILTVIGKNTNKE